MLCSFQKGIPGSVHDKSQGHFEKPQTQLIFSFLLDCEKWKPGPGICRLFQFGNVRRAKAQQELSFVCIGLCTSLTTACHNHPDDHHHHDEDVDSGEANDDHDDDKNDEKNDHGHDDDLTRMMMTAARLMMMTTLGNGGGRACHWASCCVPAPTICI